MAHYAAELFVQCVYSLDLTYHELLETEGALKISMTAILERKGGEFIHFEEMGDTMRAQCVFHEHSESLCHALCKALAPLMDGRVEARLLLVDKDLDALLYYTLSQGTWQEAALRIPLAGPLSQALREQNPKSNNAPAKAAPLPRI